MGIRTLLQVRKNGYQLIRKNEEKRCTAVQAEKRQESMGHILCGTEYSFKEYLWLTSLVAILVCFILLGVYEASEPRAHAGWTATDAWCGALSIATVGSTWHFD